MVMLLVIAAVLFTHSRITVLFQSRVAVAFLPRTFTHEDVVNLVKDVGAPSDISLSLPHAETETIVATITFPDPDAAQVRN